MAENLNGRGGRVLSIWLPPELDAIGVGPDIQRFFDAMLYKLRRNHHKGNWDTLPAAKAWADLQAEVDELHEAIINGSSAEILFEAADVANEALICANIALQARRPEVRPSVGAEQSQDHGDVRPAPGLGEEIRAGLSRRAGRGALETWDDGEIIPNEHWGLGGWDFG